MTDGAQQASQDTSHAHHSLCIKTWARTLPQASNDSHVHEQYARYLDNLESGDSVVKHSVDTLAVSRATIAAHFRWLSTARRLPDSDISKYILTRRSDFVRQSEGLDNVFDLEELEDFHKASGSTDKRSALQENPRRTVTESRPLHIYGRKSTAPRSQASPYVRSNAVLVAFRRLLDSPSSQESSRDSIHSSTPRTKRKRIPMMVDSPAVSAAFDQTSQASSLSPSPSPPIVRSKAKLVHHGIKRVRLDPEIRGRQPLRLQAPTSAIPQRGPNQDSSVSVASKKSKLTLRPITRKIPSNGIPWETRVPMHKALDKVFSHARRLQGFGGSWPLKGREVVAEHVVEEGMGGDTTEIIEDYTIQLDAFSSSPVRPAAQNTEVIKSFRQISSTLVHNRNTNESAASPARVAEQPASHPRVHPEEDHQVEDGEGVQPAPSIPDGMTFFQSHVALNPVTTSDRFISTHGSFAAPLRSTNLPEPPSPPSLANDAPSLAPPILESNEARQAGGDSTLPSPLCAQTRVYQRDVPEISVTLPTSPMASSRHARGSVLQALATPETEDTSATSIIPLEQEANTVTIDLFLSLAFGSRSATPSGRFLRHILPSRCVPRFRTLSKAISSSPIAQVLVPDESLHGGGMFGEGYLGLGRRGFWELPLTVKKPSSYKTSQAIVLGLDNCSFGEELYPSPVVWTLQRLRYFLARLEDLARLGKFGVLTVSTTGLKGAESVQISCQASLALILRTVFSEIACPLDEDGNEVCEMSENMGFGDGRSRLGDKWLSAESGIRLVWWDEIERCPVLLS